MRRLLLTITIISVSVLSFAQNSVYYWFDGQQSQNAVEGNEINTEGLTTGIHFVHFQIKGSDGLLGPVKSKSFLVVNDEDINPSSFSGINYWFDHQKTMNAYTGGPIDCSELAVGLHAAHFQIIDSENRQCPVKSQFFLQLQSEAYKIRYWFDDDDADCYTEYVSTTELSVESLDCGHHTLYVQLLDSKGMAVMKDPVSANFVIVCPDDNHTDADDDGVCDVCEEPLYYSRLTTQGRYGTVCLPKGAPSVKISGATVYSVAGKRVNGSGDVTSLVLEEVSDMVAGQPYIFLATGSQMKVVYEGAVVDAPLADNGLVGSFAGQDVEEGMYLLSNNEIVKCGTGCTIGINRAYINMDEVPEYVEGTVAPAKMAVISSGVVTAVNRVTIEGDAVRYNLSGIRIPHGTKGIVIINGKKIIQK